MVNVRLTPGSVKWKWAPIRTQRGLSLEKNQPWENHISPLLLPPLIGKGEAAPKTALASPPITMTTDESREVGEEMEGITVVMEVTSVTTCQGSSDSMLSGTWLIPQETSRKKCKKLSQSGREILS